MDKEYVERFTDKFGLISCDKNPSAPNCANTTGNGVLFSAALNAASNFGYPNYEAIRKCVIDGILWRNPVKEQGYDSHDNYIGFAFMMHEQDCRPLFWSCAKKFFYLGGNHMWRFPHVWAMMFLSSYNNILTKILMFPLFYVISQLQNPLKEGLNNTSALQLQYVIIKYLDMMYPGFEFYKSWRTKLLQVAPGGEKDFFSIYYSPIHPTTKCFETEQSQ